MNFEASSQGCFPEVPKGWDIQGDLDAALEAAPPQPQARPSLAEAAVLGAAVPPPQAAQSQEILGEPQSQTQLIDSQSQEVLPAAQLVLVEDSAASGVPPAGASIAGNVPAPASASAGTPPTTPQTKSRPLGAGEKHAIKMYADAHGLNPDTITLDIVANSPEKLMHWANLGVDWGARDSTSQCFYRSMKHVAGDWERDMYKDLDDPLKKEYRQCWNIKRDYQFTTETKIIQMTYEKESIDAGSYRTQDQIAVELGLPGYPMECAARTRILNLAGGYVGRCKIFGGRWLFQNEWLEDSGVKELFSRCSV